MRFEAALRVASVTLALGPLACHSEDPPAAPHPAPAHDVATFFRQLPGELRALDSSEDFSSFVARTRRIPGIARVDSNDASVTLALAPPLGSRKLAHWLGLRRAFIVAGDAGATSWHVVAIQQRARGPRGYRHAYAGLPSYGNYRVELVADGRPEGPVPAAQSGGELAYPVRDYPVKVSRVVISRY